MKDFIKQNLFIVAMVGAALLAGGVYIFPMMTFGRAAEQAEQIATLSQRLSSATRPGAYESPSWIDQSKAGIEAIRAIQEQVIEASMKFGTRMPLLVKGNLIFPAPAEAQRFAFAAAYKDALAALMTKLAADVPPTEEEIRTAAEAERKRLAERHAQEPANLEQGIRASLVRARAEKTRIWAGKEALDDYVKNNLGGSSLQRMTNEQLWEAQLNYWVQKDIVDTIAALNSQPRPGTEEKPKCVLDAPVKELCGVKVERLYYLGTGQGVEPAVTGHITDYNYDVLHYTVRVVIDSERLADLVEQLCARNFHTLLTLKYEPLDKKPSLLGSGAADKGEGVDYGEGNVILATLSFESIFMKSPRSWRSNPEEGRKKKAAFLTRKDDKGDNRKLVLEVQRVAPDGSVQAVELAYKDMAASAAKLDELLKKNDPALRFIALYEDLMPESVKSRSPGLSKNPTAK